MSTALPPIKIGDMLRSPGSGLIGRVITITPPHPSVGPGPGSVTISCCNGELCIGGPPGQFERVPPEKEG